MAEFCAACPQMLWSRLAYQANWQYIYDTRMGEYILCIGLSENSNLPGDNGNVTTYCEHTNVRNNT